MGKSKYNKNKSKKNKSKKNKLNKRKRTCKYKKTNCCMCEKKINIKGSLIPSGCSLAHGKEAAHRICENCWFHSEDGFVMENRSHYCPGCEKHMSLTPVRIKPPIFIDLSNETDDE